MLAAFSTLAFAATLWLVVVILARLIEEDGPRIVSAAARQPGREFVAAGRRPASRGQIRMRVSTGSLPVLSAAA